MDKESYIDWYTGRYGYGPSEYLLEKYYPSVLSSEILKTTEENTENKKIEILISSTEMVENTNSLTESLTIKKLDVGEVKTNESNMPDESVNIIDFASWYMANKW